MRGKFCGTNFLQTPKLKITEIPAAYLAIVYFLLCRLWVDRNEE